MSAVVQAPVRTRPDPRSLRGETGMVERPRRRFLPFDPWHLFLAPLAAVMLLPLLWMVVTSLETEAQTFHFPPILWPGTLRFGNYAEVLGQSAFGTWFWNTTVVTVTVVASNLVLCTLAAYAFARVRFLGRTFVYFVILATLMVPLQVVLIPTFLIVKELGLLDHLGALVVPNLVNVFGIFLLTQFFRTLPIELEEAARIDGAGRWGVFRNVTLPHLRPTTLLVTTLGLIGTWQVFDQVYVMTQGGPGKTTLTPAFLSYFYAFENQKWGVAAAMAFILFLIIFASASLQRWLFRDKDAAALKRQERRTKKARARAVARGAA